MNNFEYWKEVRETAANVVGTVDDIIHNQSFKDTMDQGYRDEITYETLHETIDGHQWIIYNYHHLPILEHSDNADYMLDNIGGLDESLKQGLDTLHCHLAFWAFYADVQDELNK